MEVLGLVLCFFVLTAVAQPGFTSIDCGGTEDFTSVNNISWVTDAGFVHSGATASINETDLATTLQTVRFFSNITSSSNCYYIPVVGNRRYVLRANYYYGNYDGQSFWPTFNSYVDGHLWSQVSGESPYAYLYEAIWTTTSDTLTVCFMSSDSQNVPFISALAIRLLPNGSYSQFDLGDIPFYRLIRRNLGAYQLLRYPEDAYDRNWYVQESSSMINTTKNVSTDGFLDVPPPLMFQSADQGPSNLTSLSYSWTLTSSVSELFAKLYFWDFRDRVQNASCMFNQTITIDGKVLDSLNKTRTLDPEFPLRYSMYIPNLPSTFTLGITFTPLANSTLPPLLNGIEVYGVGLQSEQPQSPPSPTLSTSPPSLPPPPPPSPPLSPRTVATSAALGGIAYILCSPALFLDATIYPLYSKFVTAHYESTNGYYGSITDATTTSDTLTVCFTSSDSQNVPFISALAIRLLPNGSYSQFDLGDIHFYRLIHRDLGAYQLLRYPDDAYDRNCYVQVSSRMINTTKSISTDGFLDGPPPLMFQSIDQGPSNLTSLSYDWTLTSSVSELFSKLYFWDFRDRVQNASCMSQTITIDGKVLDSLNKTCTHDPEFPLRYSLYIPNFPSTFTLGITFTPLANSILPPLLNGIEVYGVGLQSEQPQSPPSPTLSTPPPPLGTPLKSFLILACFFCIFSWTIL